MRTIRWSIVVHWLIAAFSVIAILGMATPNCMQTVSFGEALWHMRMESHMPVLLLLVLAETALVYAFAGVAPGVTPRLLIAVGGTLCAAAVPIGSHSPLHGPVVAILAAPLDPFAIARGVPGLAWAEGYVVGSAFGLWVWLWAILGVTEVWRGTTTNSSLQNDPRGRGSFCG